MSKTLTMMILLGFYITTAQAKNELRSSLTDQQEVTVTIYNNNLALVKDQRQISLASGENNLAFSDISAQMQSETAQLRSISHPGSLMVYEQNFDFDLLTPESLLQKYVGKMVDVIKTNPTTGTESRERAQVLSAQNGVVLKIGSRIETGIPGRIAYDEVPANLRDRPTLVMSLNNGGVSNQAVELSYLTTGLSWKSDYVIELSPNDDKLDIAGWVTLNNTSGATYRNAKLQLVAGDVNRAPQELLDNRMTLQEGRVALAMVPAPKMAEESIFEYHLYTLSQPTSIAENQTKQVALLSAFNVASRKELLLAGSDYYYQSSYGDIGQKMKVGVFLEFDNQENQRLGMPLPKGIVRVYKKDKSGNAQFIGEDKIDHTPKNEKVRLKLGDAFDVTASKKQTDFKRLSSNAKFGFVAESAYEIVLKNAKKEAVTVKIQEPIPGDWQMQSESQTHHKETSNTATWQVTIPAEGKAKLSYRVLVRI